MIGILICQIALSIVLASIFLIRPSLTSATGWKIVAFIGLCVLPALCIVGGMNTHVQRSETTRFCVSCHVMIPYGQSLYVDDPNHIPAQHFQNHRVPANMACYSCHADYSIYGPLNDKMQGLKRIYMQYVSTPPDPAAIRIAGGSRTSNACIAILGLAISRKTCSRRDNGLTQIESDVLPQQRLPRTAHDVANLSHEKFWRPAQMKLNQIGIRRLLQVSSALKIAGLLLEIVSLLWFHPLSFVLFAFVAASLIGLGILVYLASLVFAVSPNAENLNDAPY